MVRDSENGGHRPQTSYSTPRRVRESFEERFRLLLTRNTLIQFFFGLMIELFVPPVGFSSAFPKFVGTMDDLFFGGCSHRVLSSLRTVNGRRPIGHCSDEEGQRALHRSPSSWDCPAPREIPSPANTMRGPISRFRDRGHIVLTFAPILTNREMVVTSTLALSRATKPKALISGEARWNYSPS
jgi:hypothetical protein